MRARLIAIVAVLAAGFAPLAARSGATAALAGVVRDERGAPLAGMDVRLLSRSLWTRAWQIDESASVATNQRGEYRFDALGPGEYVVGVLAARAPAPARQTYVTTFFPGAFDPSAATPIAVAAGEVRDQVNVQVRPVAAVTVSGQIAGPPAAHAGVRLELYRSDESSRLPALVVAATETGDAGTFRFPVVPAGEYTIEAIRDNGTTTGGFPFWGREGVTVTARDVADVTVTMQPALIVSGRIAFEDAAPGAPPAGRVSIALQAISTRLVWPVESNPRIMSGTIDAEGRFTVTGVPPGKYVVQRAQGYGRWYLAHALAPGTADAADRPFDVDADLSGIVATFSDKAAALTGVSRTAAGALAAGGSVVLFSADADLWLPFSRRTRVATAAPDGTFAFDELPSGDYYVAATREVDFRRMGRTLLESLAAGAARVRLGAAEHKSQDVVQR